ncbi:MAG TPA: S4 domain-containing protein, partial [Bacillota bacterium]|nr:S4 domain-containing protein [Bacillota bacterium]
MKLQKLLAQAGVCSRRSAEEMIREEKVTVNGEKAALGMRVDGTEEIIFNGKRVDTPEQKAYYILNKPVG